MTAKGVRLRYRTDPEYRARKIGNGKAFVEKTCRKFPTYTELIKVRKQICTARDTLDRLLLRTERQEKKLLGLIAQRDRLAKAYREERRSS